MRKSRKAEEEFFVQKFLGHFRTNIDEHAREISGVTDKPDLAISSLGRIIGVELSQFPSSYIISELHRRRPAPVYTKNEIEGHLSVYPFEPHRWVHEVLDKKRQKVEAYKKRIKANEMWLVMHCMSTTNEWPMSSGSRAKTREAEALLMRFGTKQYRSNFDRIFYIYADGTVVDLTDKSVPVPSKVSLPVGAGYPAMTHHVFSLSFDIPLPGLGIYERYFNNIRFTDNIVSPMDEWMAERDPHIDRPRFTASARINSEQVECKITRDGVIVGNFVHIASDQIGKTINLDFLLEWSIQETGFTCHADAHIYR